MYLIILITIEIIPAIAPGIKSIPSEEQDVISAYKKLINFPPQTNHY